ncbi:MAG: peptidase MA family metallohydrolase, partial [Dehalococcoidia bacterium]
MAVEEQGGLSIVMGHIGAAALIAALVVVLSVSAGDRAGRAATAAADSAVQITGTPTVDNKFPAEIVFNVDAKSSAGDVSDVTLHYVLLPTGTDSSASAVFDKGPSVHASYHLRTGGNPLYLPPTKSIRYFWTVQDAAGNQAQSDPVEWQYQDTRFPFKTASNGNLTLYYYAGTNTNVQRILSIGRAALDKAGSLDGAPLDFPVHLVVYRTQADVGAALSHESKSVDPNILGQADPPDIVVLVAGDLSGAENEDTVRHELTHLANARAVQGPYEAALPIWLDEGLAVFGQNQPTGFDQAVSAAIKRDAVVPLRSLTPGLRGTDAGLFYGESWSIVRYLVTAFGNQKLADLMAAFKAGKTEDVAFTAVYGMDRDGIYNAWRKNVGLAPVAVTAPTQAAPSSRSQQSQPAPTQQAPSSSSQQAQPSRPASTRPAQFGSNAGAQPTQPPAPVRSSTVATASSSENATVVVLAVLGSVAFSVLLAAVVVGGLFLSHRS